MRRAALILTVLAVSAAPASASWNAVRSDRSTPILSLARAQHALIAYGRADHPRNVTLSGCQRLNLRAVRCWINETGVLMPFLNNGQTVTGNADWFTVATLRHGHVSMRLN